MTIHLYQQSHASALNLAERSLRTLGFSIHILDAGNGLLSASRPHKTEMDILFFDVKVIRSRLSVKMILCSSVFSGNSGTFSNDVESETSFLEALHDLLHIVPPDNPMRLSAADYALASGF